MDEQGPCLKWELLAGAYVGRKTVEVVAFLLLQFGLSIVYILPSGVATVGCRGGRSPPPGSILELKKCKFSYDAINVKNFFWTANLRFQNFCPPPPEGLPPLEIFLATPLID